MIRTPNRCCPTFSKRSAPAGVTHFIIHARKAWLQGSVPKENRDIPPLDYDLVLRMKAAFPHLTICINGGVTTLAQAKALLDQGLDGVMIGRAAYHDPATALIGADALWGDDFAPDPFAVDRRDAPLYRGPSGQRRAPAPDHPPHAGSVSGPSRRARLAAGAVRRLGRRAGHAGRGPGPGSGSTPSAA